MEERRLRPGLHLVSKLDSFSDTVTDPDRSERVYYVWTTEVPVESNKKHEAIPNHHNARVCSSCFYGVHHTGRGHVNVLQVWLHRGGLLNARNSRNHRLSASNQLSRKFYTLLHIQYDILEKFSAHLLWGVYKDSIHA